MHLFCLFSLPLFLFSVCFQLKTENTAFCVCSWSFPDLLGTRSPPAPGGCSLHLGSVLSASRHCSGVRMDSVFQNAQRSRVHLERYFPQSSRGPGLADPPELSGSLQKP